MEQAPNDVLDLRQALERGGSGAIARLESDDLDLNLVRFADGAGVGAHVNREVDVFLVVVAGQGTVTVDGVAHQLLPWQALLIPRGAERSIASPPAGEFAYLSLHRRRRGLWPSPVER